MHDAMERILRVIDESALDAKNERMRSSSCRRNPVKKIKQKEKSVSYVEVGFTKRFIVIARLNDSTHPI